MIFVTKNTEYVTIPGHIVTYLTTGQGVFEALLFSENQLWFWQRHAARLIKTLARFSVKMDTDALWRELTSHLKENFPGRHLRIKITIPFAFDRNKKNISLNDVVIQLEDLDTDEVIPSSMRLQLHPSPFNAKNAQVSAKSINYGYNIFATSLSIENGFGEALFYNDDGYLIEASRANIFAVKNGNLFTPKLDLNLLPGIVRSILVEQLQAEETAIPINSLDDYDCFFLTGSVREIMPVEAISDYTFPLGSEYLNQIEQKWQEIKHAYLKGDFN